VVGSSIEVTEEKLRDYWRQHQDEFQAPEERRIRHILIAAPEGADAETEAEAKARAEDVYERLQKGEKFEELAKAVSEDPGSKEQGGDLGWISPGIMARAFEDAAYALKKGEISKPVRTPFGFHVLQVVDIKSGGEGSFEAMRDRIGAAYRRQQAEQLLFDKAEKLADLTYENPDSLEVAATGRGPGAGTPGGGTRSRADTAIRAGEGESDAGTEAGEGFRTGAQGGRGLGGCRELGRYLAGKARPEEGVEVRAAGLYRTPCHPGAFRSGERRGGSTCSRPISDAVPPRRLPQW